MRSIGGITQEKLDEIWKSLLGNNPNLSATKVVDDDVEQVMAINTTQGKVSVSRKSGGVWHETPSAGDPIFI